jgi:hypothetical protein
MMLLFLGVVSCSKLPAWFPSLTTCDKYMEIAFGIGARRMCPDNCA